mmetsp:Transcript_7263/g.20513  ORF Transcript_7263/g.20513 Transcript_7263/m.20513 type:complete len:255 (-) Transcript_7263:2747-3511(-)
MFLTDKASSSSTWRGIFPALSMCSSRSTTGMKQAARTDPARSLPARRLLLRSAPRPTRPPPSALRSSVLVPLLFPFFSKAAWGTLPPVSAAGATTVARRAMAARRWPRCSKGSTSRMLVPSSAGFIGSRALPENLAHTSATDSSTATSCTQPWSALQGSETAARRSSARAVRKGTRGQTGMPKRSKPKPPVVAVGMDCCWLVVRVILGARRSRPAKGRREIVRGLSGDGGLKCTQENSVPQNEYIITNTSTDST